MNALLLAQGSQQTYSGTYHRTSNSNLGLQLDYNYAGKYYADFSMAAVHSAKLPEGNRIGLSPSFTLGWRLSEEGFLKDADWLDNLKLMAGYSVLNQIWISVITTCMLPSLHRQVRGGMERGKQLDADHRLPARWKPRPRLHQA